MKEKKGYRSYVKSHSKTSSSLSIKAKKKQEDGKYQKFLFMLKELSTNIPLVEELE